MKWDRRERQVQGDHVTTRQLRLIAALAGASGVAIGAFGAHGLPGYLGEIPELAKRLEQFETGTRYHMYHAVALLALNCFPTEWPATAKLPARLTFAAIAWLTGIVVFSGCLYALVLTGQAWLGAVVPIGGVAFIAGWISLGLPGGGLRKTGA